MTEEQINAHKVRAVHNKLFVDALSRSITALSMPLVNEASSIKWASAYTMSSKPTQIEGI